MVFLLLTMLEPHFSQRWYPDLYTLKMALVTLTLYFCRGTLKDYKTDRSALLPAAAWGIAAGILVFAFWIPLDRVTPFHFGGSRAEYNPFHAIALPALRLLFLAMRFYGLVVLVPVTEELLWRSFLPRFISAPDGDVSALPTGQFSNMGMLVSAAGFALAHPEWLSALLCAIVYSLIVRKTGSLLSSLTAHMATNLALGIFILSTGNWKYW